MPSPAVSLADLLRALAHARPGEAERMARAAGFDAAPHGENDRSDPYTDAPPLRREADAQGPDAGTGSTATQPPQQVPAATKTAAPVPTTEVQAPVFWRVLAEHTEEESDPQLPDWLSAGAPDEAVFVRDPVVPPPIHRRLVPEARAAVALRRMLARTRRGAAVDLPRLVDGLAQARPMATLPRRLHARWPGRVQVLVDVSPRMRPLDADAADWRQAVHRSLRGRCSVVSSQGPPLEADVQGRPHWSVRFDGSSLLVLGDGGLGADEATAALWRRLFDRVEAAGGHPVLLAAAPARCSGVLAKSGLQAWRYDDLVVTPATARTASVVVDSGARAAADALSAALLYHPAVDRRLLRNLRRVLQRFGLATDVAHEQQVWHSPSVRSGAVNCRLRSEAASAALDLWREWPAALRNALVAVHWRSLVSDSPTVRAEYALAATGLVDPGSAIGQALARGRRQAEVLMQHSAAVQWAALRAHAQGQPCAAAELGEELGLYLRGLALRTPAALAAPAPGTRVAWMLAHHVELTRGALDPLPGLTAAELGWLERLTDPSITARAGDRRWCVRLTATPQGMQASLVPVSGSDVNAPAGMALTPQTEPYAECRPDPDADGSCAAFLAVWQRVRQCAHDPRWPLQAFAEALARDRRLPPAAAGGLAPRIVELRRWLTVTTASSVSVDESSAREALGAMRLWATSGARGGQVDPFVDWCQWLLDAWQRVDPDAAAAEARRLHAPLSPLAVAGEPRLLDPNLAYRVTHGPHMAWLGSFCRPAWADKVLARADGLYLHTSDRPDDAATARWLRWVPDSVWPVVGGSGDVVWKPAHAAWWDVEDHHFLFDRGRPRLRCPAWATAGHGVDAYGWWADLTLSTLHGQATQRFRFFPPGRFWMGSPAAEPGRFHDESLHPVALTRGFWLADTACTQGLWRAVIGSLPEGQTAAGDDLPVANISHDLIVQRFLPTLERVVPGLAARLPSEAEWEYACRDAGAASGSFWWGEGLTPDQANYDGTEPLFGESNGKWRQKVLPVRSFEPSRCGLYQMHGNVWEWCADWLAGCVEGEALDPTGPLEVPAEPVWRVLRGGSWISDAGGCRSASRNAGDPSVRDDFIGFRLARGFSNGNRPEAGAEPVRRGASSVPEEPAAGAPAKRARKLPPSSKR